MCFQRLISNSVIHCEFLLLNIIIDSVLLGHLLESYHLIWTMLFVVVSQPQTGLCVHIIPLHHPYLTLQLFPTTANLNPSHSLPFSELQFPALRLCLLLQWYNQWKPLCISASRKSLALRISPANSSVAVVFLRHLHHHHSPFLKNFWNIFFTLSCIHLWLLFLWPLYWNQWWSLLLYFKQAFLYRGYWIRVGDI